jgi:VWFA-related protein
VVSIKPREAPRASSFRPNLKIDSAMVLVPITVTDATDHPVTDLAPDAFRIFDDNVEQKVVSFHREDGPVSVGFIFDASSSMKGRMDRSTAAIQQFLKTFTKGDEFFLIRFSDRPTLLQDFTEDPDAILSELSFVQPQGWTALNDAICLGLHRIKHARNPRRALFVLTDGGDNNSRYSDAEVRSLAQDSDVRIYSIGLFERPRFLEKLAIDTGGRAIWAHKLQELPETVDQISRDFRNQYVLGYSPLERPHDGKYHNVRVEIVKTLKLMPLNVFWRRGYFAPPE